MADQRAWPRRRGATPHADGAPARHGRFELDVAYLLPWKDEFAAELRDHGVDVRCLDARRTVDRRWVLRLRRQLRSRDYALVHTHSPVPAAAARVLTGSGTPLVHTEHNVWDRYRWPTHAANALTYARNDAVLAVSDGVASSISPPRWAPGTPPPVETLLHGVSPDTAPRGREVRERARATLRLAPDVPVLGNVANLTTKEDHAGSLVALDQVPLRVPDVVLLLIGAGPLEDALRDDARGRGLEEHVRFLGMRDDVPEVLPALDVFVLGSRFEGLPISLLEAMAAEVPCVATRVVGIPEAITDGREGRLVPAGQPDQLASAIVELLLDPATRARFAAAGLTRVTDEFSIGRAVARTEELYEGLISRRR